MSRHLLGLPYVELKTLLYPHPPYKSFVIKKRNGTSRFINEPRQKLKDLQAILLAYLYGHAASMKPCVHGFTPGHSIVTNANAHCSPKTRFLLNIDIEDFFPSITFYRVRGILQSKPFAFSYSVATALAQLCTFNGVLPKGAPTSPLLANLARRSLDGELMNLAKHHRATYSRYADDITFSFSVVRSESLPANVCSFDSGILTLGEELRAIFASHSFRINPNKSRLSSRRHRLEVTGSQSINFRTLNVSSLMPSVGGFMLGKFTATHLRKLNGRKGLLMKWVRIMSIVHGKGRRALESYQN